MFITLCERWEWIKSERFHKREKEAAKAREANNPMKICVLKYDHFENIHRLDPKLPAYEGAPNFRQARRGEDGHQVRLYCVL